MRIRHQRFGEGEIFKIDTSGAEPKIAVVFDETDNRMLLLKFAVFKIL